MGHGDLLIAGALALPRVGALTVLVKHNERVTAVKVFGASVNLLNSAAPLAIRRLNTEHSTVNPKYIVELLHTGRSLALKYRESLLEELQEILRLLALAHAHPRHAAAQDPLTDLVHCCACVSELLTRELGTHPADHVPMLGALDIYHIGGFIEEHPELSVDAGDRLQQVFEPVLGYRVAVSQLIHSQLGGCQVLVGNLRDVLLLSSGHVQALAFAEVFLGVLVVALEETHEDGVLSAFRQPGHTGTDGLLPQSFVLSG